MNQTQLVEAIESTLSRYPDINLVILYGSWAQGRATPASDADVAIAGDQSFSIEALAALNLELAKALGSEVDLVDLSVLHGVILKEILCHGKVVLKRSPIQYGHLISRMWAEQADLMPQIRKILAFRRQRDFGV